MKVVVWYVSEWGYLGHVVDGSESMEHLVSSDVHTGPISSTFHAKLCVMLDPIFDVGLASCRTRPS